ncbi:MAG: arylsulfotransferase family protein [Bradymonadaceae bacterium]
MASDSRPIVERLFRVGSILGIAVLAFTAGAFTTEFRATPHPELLAPAFQAIRVVDRRLRPPHLPEDVWVQTRHRPGVYNRVPSRSWGRYTLLSTGHTQSIYLVDRDGTLVHRWHRPFREAFPEAPHLEKVAPPAAIDLIGLHLYPDGRVLGLYDASGVSPYGYGVVALEADSEVAWTYAGHAHHDLEVGPDGDVWTLTHDWRDPVEEPIRGFDRNPVQVLEDFVVRLSESGEVEDRFSLVDTIADSDRYRVLGRWLGAKACRKSWDLLHANSVEPVTSDFAEHHDFADRGDLLISVRTLDALMLVDPDSHQLQWLERGFWKGQHDPDALPNGHILVYDNAGGTEPGGASRVVEFDPSTGRRVWAWGGGRDVRFEDSWGGAQQALPNGNVLITEPIGARVLEVTRAGEIVWEYRPPSQVTYRGDQISAIVRPATRLSAGAVDFPLERPEPGAGRFELDRPRTVEW